MFKLMSRCAILGLTTGLMMASQNVMANITIQAENGYGASKFTTARVDGRTVIQLARNVGKKQLNGTKPKNDSQSKKYNFNVTNKGCFTIKLVAKRNKRAHERDLHNDAWFKLTKGSKVIKNYSKMAHQGNQFSPFDDRSIYDDHRNRKTYRVNLSTGQHTFMLAPRSGFYAIDAIKIQSCDGRSKVAGGSKATNNQNTKPKAQPNKSNKPKAQNNRKSNCVLSARVPAQQAKSRLRARGCKNIRKITSQGVWRGTR